MGGHNSAIRHAITAPSFERDHAHRSRLVNDLTQNLHRRLLIIAAPAGYGKTTILADFTAHSDVPVVWVRLSEADQDPARLARIVWASLSRRFRRLSKVLDLGAHAGAPPQAVANLIGDSISARVPEDFVFVVDDVHLINGAEGSLDFLAELIGSAPENMTAMIAGRQVPEIPLVHWIAKDQLRSYGALELALDLDELRAVLAKRLDGKLDEGEALSLLEETDGWVTGVLLSDMLAGQQLTSLQGTDQPLSYEYLASSVFEHQPAQIKEFLLTSAVLPVMTAEACDEVLRRDDSEMMLVEMLRRGLFVSVTGEDPRAYEYHDLFREFLLARPEQDANQLRKIRLRAADYFAQHDHSELAFALYFAADEYDHARDTAEKYLTPLYESGRDHTLLSWVHDLSRQDKASSKLLRYAALVEGQRGNHSAAANLLGQARNRARNTGNKLAEFRTWTCEIDILEPTSQKADWDRAISNVRRLSSEMNNEEAAAEFLAIEASHALYGEGRVEYALSKLKGLLDRNGQHLTPYLRVSVLVDIAVCRLFLGELEAAQRSFQEAYRLARSRNSRLRQVTCLFGLGYVSHLLGNYHAAFDRIARCRELAVELNYPMRIHLANLTLGEMSSDHRLNQVAVEHLEHAVETILESGVEYWIPYTVARLSMAYRRAQRVNDAREIWSGIDTRQGQPYWRGLATLERAAVFELSDPARFEQTVRWIREVHNPHIRVHCLTLLAIAFLDSDQHREGQDYLATALRLAEEHNLTQIVAAEANSYPVLREALEAGKRRQPETVEEVLVRLESMAEFVRSRQFPEDDSGETASGRQPTLFGTKEDGPMIGGKIDQLKPLHREIFSFILDRRTVSSAMLRNQFWPDMDRERQTENLHSAIHAIRNELGSNVIKTNSEGYTAGERIRLESEDFERAAGLALKLDLSAPETEQIASEALELFPGEFLPEFDAQWVLNRRRQLNEMFIRTAERYGRLVSGDRNRLRAIGYLEAALRLDPHRESLVLVYLENLAQEGRFHEVKMQAARYRRRLAEELQLTPTKAFERRYAELIERRTTDHPLAPLAY